MKHVISVLVQNRAGVLSRVAGLFSRRGFNIDSLAVGETQDKSVSRMTIVVDGDEYIVDQVEKQLDKLVDVIMVKELEPLVLTRRELILVKVNGKPKKRSEVIDIARVLGAKIVDISPATLTVELCDRPERIELLIELLAPYGIEEIARTGTVALEKGAGTIRPEETPAKKGKRK